MSSSSESTFFVEYNEVIDLISLLPEDENENEIGNENQNTSTLETLTLETSASNSNTTASATVTATATATATTATDDPNVSTTSCTKPKIQNGNEALTQLKKIFDKYLECPTLLDCKLEHILSLLSKESIAIIHEVHDHLVSLSLPMSIISPKTASKPVQVQEQEQEQVQIGSKIKILKRYLSLIYTISKVRSYKHVSKYLSHETRDVEPVLCTLRYIEEKKHNNYNEDDNDNEVAETWEAVYVLLLWIGMLSLVPFDLNTIDSNLDSNLETCDMNIVSSTNTNTKSKTKTKTTLISSMVTTIQKHLEDAGSARVIASWSLAKLFSRPDLEEEELQRFVLFSNTVLQNFLLGSGSESTNIHMSNTNSIFLVMGIIQTLAHIFKSGNRSTLMERHLSIIEILWENAILLSERSSSAYSSSESSGGGGGFSSTSLVLRKLLVKLFARVGCSYLPPRIAEWRYQRGKRSLLENLAVSTNGNNHDRGNEMPSKGENQQEENQSVNENYGDNDFFHVPDQVEDSMAQLIQSLTDPATTVRWSAAKGIGRLTERLPVLCANDVLDAILELCNNEQNLENDNIWHGSCLTLAELARRGLLLPSRLKEVMPIVIQAIQYDVPRGSHSVGSHVRDAASYVCWAFARAYAPSILRPYVVELSKAIVIASLFDREINCRRAASASFQECVGRQGADNFKHGIAILTTADYFTLGNRAESFTTVAKKIASFEEYRHPIIDHLCDEKLFHWDVDIRKLSSVALRMLTSLEPDYFSKTVLPNLIPLCTHENLSVRHGAVLGVAEVMLALGPGGWEGSGDGYSLSPTKDFDRANNNYLTDELTTLLSGVVFEIEKARLYRGRGGEIMRSAVSRYIECLSKSKIPLTVKQQVGLLDSLDINMKHPNEDIQKAAAAALSALMDAYFPVGANGPSERLQNRVVNNYIKIIREEENAAATRGFSLALGHLPAKLLAHTTVQLDAVIDCLSYASNHQTKVGQQGDAETRRNAIESLVRLCETVGVGCSEDKVDVQEYPVVGLNKKQVAKVFQSLLSSLKDYNTDRRGDVGSWSRIAAMKGLVTVTSLAVKASNIPQASYSSDPSRNEESCENILPVTPTFRMRVEKYFEADVENKVEECLINNKPYRDYQATSFLSQIYFDDQLCAEVLGGILKQLAEKLDAVRCQAGSCLVELLSGSNMTPFLPCKDMLLEGLGLDSQHNQIEKETNWANPAFTFPLLMRVINIDAFFYPIISGLVISVGGLTESVTKHSTKAFLDYFRALQKGRMIGRISKIGKGKLSWKWQMI